MEHTGLDLSLLRRWPDVEAPGLLAVDAVDRLLLDLAPREEPIAVIGDHYGALTLALAAEGNGRLRSYQDSFVGRRALAANAARLGLTAWQDDPEPAPPARLPRLEDEVAGARVVLWQLPKSLSEVRETARIIAAHAGADVTLVAGARIKYLPRSVAETLGETFRDVQSSLARQKSRALIATGPVREDLLAPGGGTEPATSGEAHAACTGEVRASTGESDVACTDESTGQFERAVDGATALTICAAGGVFAGPRLDLGTRFLAGHMSQMPERPARVLDLGSGNGALAAMLARYRPAAEVWAADVSLAAVRSTLATAQANGVRVRAVWDDAGSSLTEASFDLVVLNPPFHSGGPVSDAAGKRLIRAAGRLLAPGGQLWTVYNSHLRYRPVLAAIGPTQQRGRDPKFTVTCTVRR